MTVKVSPKYQVVIPEEVRQALNIIPGMRVSVIAKDGIAYLVPVKTFGELRKTFAGKFTDQDKKSFRDKKDRKL